MKAYQTPTIIFVQLEENDLIATSNFCISDEETEVQYAGRRNRPIWDE